MKEESVKNKFCVRKAAFEMLLTFHHYLKVKNKNDQKPYSACTSFEMA